MKTKLKRNFLRAASAGLVVALIQAPDALAFTGTCSMLITGPVPYGAVTSTDSVTMTNVANSQPTLIDKTGALVPGFATPAPVAIAGGSYGHVTRKELPTIAGGSPGGFVSDYNSLAVVDFTTNTLSMSMVFVQYGFSRPTVMGTGIYSNIPFTVAAGPLPGSQKTTILFPALNVPGVGTLPAHSGSSIMVPVNGGKTLLVQGIGNPVSGVCQF